MKSLYCHCICIQRNLERCSCWCHEGQHITTQQYNKLKKIKRTTKCSGTSTPPEYIPMMSHDVLCHFVGDVCILLLCDWRDEMYDLIVHRVEADQVIYSTVNKPPKTRMRWASLHPAYQCIPWSTEKQYYFKGYLLVKCLKSYQDYVHNNIFIDIFLIYTW